MLVLGEHARELIGSSLEQYGELLPLSCEGQRFWTLNVTSFVDALDEGASQVVRASETGRPLMIRRHAFKAEPLEGAEVFKLPQTPRGLIYVTESFSERLRDSKLAGLQLVQLWAPN